jgi:hypothetical protein
MLQNNCPKGEKKNALLHMKKHSPKLSKYLVSGWVGRWVEALTLKKKTLCIQPSYPKPQNPLKQKDLAM